MAIVYHEKMIDNPAMHLINWLFFIISYLKYQSICEVKQCNFWSF